MKGKDFHVIGPSYKQRAPPQHYFDGPPLNSAVKKLNMSVVWKDQGWGNLKGEIFIQLMRPSKEKASELKVVAEKLRVFGGAKHHEVTANAEIVNHPITSLAKPGDLYRFMRHVGSGGGHTLTVKKFKAVATLTRSKQE